MAKLKIVKEGDPLLRKTSRPVTEITPRILTLLDDMAETMRAEGEQEEAEGCLSIPGKYGITHRPKKVVVLAENRHGETVEYMGEDLLARAFCHEIDHLDGKLFTDCVVRMLDEE